MKSDFLLLMPSKKMSNGAKKAWETRRRKIRRVRLKGGIKGTYLKWGNLAFPRSPVPKDNYIILKEGKSTVTVAVELERGIPSAKHIYRLTKKSFEKARR